METICLTCLEKEPERRYSSAQALADDLGRFLRGEPIAARRAGTAERLSKWSRRNPALAGLVVTAIVATALLVGGLLWSNMTISSALRATEEQRELTAESAELARRRERVARRYAYNVDMRLAQQAWNSGSPGETRNLLAKHKPSAGQEDLRGFEWRQMWDELDRYSQVVATQPTPVSSLTAAGDDRSFATGDRDGTIRLWGLAPPGMLREWHAHDGVVTSLVFCQGGQVLVSAGADHMIRFWHVATGEMIHVFDEHHGSVNMLALSADEEHLVSGGDDGRVLEWSLQSGDMFKELYRHESAVRWVVAHPREPWDNRTLFASGSDDGEVRMWDFDENRLRHFEATVPVSRNAVIDGSDYLWSSVASKLIGWKYGHTNKPGTIEDRINTRETLWIAAAGDYLLEAGKDPPEIRVRSLIANEDRRVVRTLRGHTGAVRYLAALAERDSFLSGSDDGTVRRWQLTIADRSTATIDLAAKVTCSGWAPNSDQIVLGLDDGRVFLVDATLKRPHRHLCTMPHPPTGVMFDSRGRRILVIDAQVGLHWIDAKRATILKTIPITSRFDRAILDPSDQYLTLLKDKQLTVIGAEDGKLLWQNEHPLTIAAEAFVGETLFTGSDDGAVRAFDVRRGELLCETPPQRSAIVSIERSQDGQRLITALRDGTVSVYDAATLAEQARFALNANILKAYFIDHDRRLLAYAPGRLHVLDPESGESLFELRGALNTNSAKVSPDGGSLLSSPAPTLTLLPLGLELPPGWNSN